MSRSSRLTTCAAALLVALCSGAATAQAGSTSGMLRAGAGQADITPPKTGYFLGGWTRADRLALGQSTRLYANALVLQRGTRKVALVAMEQFAVPAGLQEDVAREVADLGYTKETILLAASHTHSGSAGYFPNPTYNTAAPGAQDLVGLNLDRVEQFIAPAPADPQLYTFEVKQVAQAVRRADADRGLAQAGWGHSTLSGLTQNRSLFAFLRNDGIVVGPDDATVAMAPGGYESTIDPNVDVLRVDKLVKHGTKLRDVPIGAWSSFADHGTVVHSENQVYSGDHHAAAWRIFSDLVRKAGKVPKKQTVVNVYPNGAEGDQTAGIAHVGIDAARMVGSTEAQSMFSAWKDAAKRMSRTPALDVRWSRQCFCGRQTATGPVDATGRAGIGFLTGSEEGRGPLYDVTGVSFEGRTAPSDDPVQGDKLVVPVGTFPPSVPFSVTRIGSGVIAAIPGEPTKQVGVLTREAVMGAMKGSGVDRVVIAGLANDFIQYITTPAEYGAQSYEGASTLYGKNEGTFVTERLAELGAALAMGAPAPASDAFDPSYGVKPDGPAYGQGAASGQITMQPAGSVARGGTIDLAWTGGPDGTDRPVDQAFTRAERLVGKRWRTVDTDLGLHSLWRVDSAGHYTLQWQPAGTVPLGTYRLRVTASRYTLTSSTFAVTAAG